VHLYIHIFLLHFIFFSNFLLIICKLVQTRSRLLRLCSKYRVFHDLWTLLQEVIS